MIEPPDGAYVLTGESPDEVFYVRDDASAAVSPESCWFVLDPSRETVDGCTWNQILTEDDRPLRMWAGPQIALSILNPMADAYSASEYACFDAGLKFAADLLCDTLGFDRPDWPTNHGPLSE